MRNLIDETLSTIKSSLQVVIKADDQETLHLTFAIPDPGEDCHPSARQQWERLKQNHKLPNDYTNRLRASIDYFKSAREAETIPEIIQLLKQLQMYLEAQAARPVVEAQWIKREGEKPNLWNAARNIRFDEFFEERVLVVTRKAIVDLEQLMSLAPPQLVKQVLSNKIDSKRPTAGVFASFTYKLVNGFTENDLDGLLKHVGFKNDKGETLKFTSYLLHHVIDELIAADYFEAGNREQDQKALQRFLGLRETRVANGQSEKKSVKTKAKIYLSKLKKQPKNNG